LDVEAIEELGYPPGTYNYFDFNRKTVTNWKPHFKNHPADRIAAEVAQNLFVTSFI